MKYDYVVNVRDNDLLRNSFNDLTRRVFAFDFEDWYKKGHWGNLYIPHVLVDKGRVISNISVNLMRFKINGQYRNYVQLGTVMTDPEYRGQGLNEYIMNKVLEEYKDKVDGIYLFANDSVTNYYPRYGFEKVQEYEYSKNVMDTPLRYELKKLNTSDEMACNKFFNQIKEYEKNGTNPNDDYWMTDNIGLYQFWTAAEYGEDIYYIPEMDTYVIARVQDNTLEVFQIEGNTLINIDGLAKSFNANINKVKLWYTPSNKSDYIFMKHNVEDSTTFYIGESLSKLETEKMVIPIISHA